MKRFITTLCLCFSVSSFAAPLPTGGLKINFAPAETSSPTGYFTDAGTAYGAGKADGTQTYGWVDSNGSPADISDYSRNRVPSPDADVVRETLVHMDHPDYAGDEHSFQVELPNGDYRIIVQVGDVIPETTAGTNHMINAEGENVITFGQVLNTSGVRNGTALVSVNDGILNLDQSGGTNTKLHALIIESADNPNTPVIVGSTPVDGAVDVEINTIISANFLDLPNESANGATSLNNDTITTDTVKLFEINTVNDIAIEGTVNGTGGGDAINFTPDAPLKANTQYRYVVDGVSDLSGHLLMPFSMVFTTGNDSSTNTGFEGVGFEKIGPIVTGTRYSSLTIGPDDKLYGLTITGDVHRWVVNTDGTLSDQEVISTLPADYGGAPRLAIGLAFDPSTTAENPVAYVSHSTFTFSGGPEYDGNISRLSGPDLGTHELVITGLPRSVRDHLTNSIAFRPNEPGVLYFLQGSNTAGGRTDGAWGNRPERLFTAALMRLDLNKLPVSLPLDVRTSDDQTVVNNASVLAPTMEDGYYNPYYQDAPLTLYATGIRNAYDLVWHSNGQLYIPTNGTAGGSLSPASVAGTRRPDGSFYAGQTVPAIGPNEVQRDFLFRVNPAEPLGYYGHPNPIRGEYVLNRASVDAGGYAATINPDENYRGFAFDFEFNISPNGVIEYQSNAHNGNLRGALLVARYSGGSDIIALRPNDTDGDIDLSRIGIPGLTGFKDPLEITEDTRYGNLYVSDYGDSELYLLRPLIPANINAVIYEAEAATLSGAQVGDANSGASGGEYAEFVNAVDDYVEWTVDAEAAGQHNLILRYALSEGANRPLALMVNGQVIDNIDFLNTGEWTDWLLTNVAVDLVSGTNTIRLTATGDSGPNIDYLGVESLVQENQAPTITLNAPVSTTGNVSGTISAIASDADGSIDRVEIYYDGVNLLLTDTEAPYEFQWDGVANGTYTLTAVATDDDGAQTTSNAVTVVVDDSPAENQAPTITLNAPVGSAGNVSGSINATASDADGSITQVEFYYDGVNLLETDITAPYELQWGGVANGTYTLTAIATDDDGVQTTSNAVTVVVDDSLVENQAPTITLNEPVSSSGNVSGSISATASDTDGSISQVEFYYDGVNLLETDITAPYELQWGGVANGTYTLTAIATDDDGAQTTSNAVMVTVDSASE